MVVVTRNRLSTLLSTLGRLNALSERPPIVVVDNDSSDGTVAAVRKSFPQVEVVGLHRNAGAGARTVGVERLDVPYVAFSDDDSWWAAGALAQATTLLERRRDLAVVAARVLVGAERREDPTCAAMAASPLARPPGLPGPLVLGFIACGSVVRRSAFLGAGGFHDRLGVGGEEALLAIDLARAGWRIAYVPEVVALHVPSPSRDARRRARVVARNDLWVAWLRRSPGAASRRTWLVLRGSLRDATTARGFLDALRGLPWVLRERERVPAEVERQLALLDRSRL